jgi:polypeptide N-acetylgalactosaminyltransferase/glutamate receptor 2/ionotropic kainate glutamate receptor 2
MGYGLAFPQNSPYTDVISEEILKLRESGFLDKLKNEWFIHKGEMETFTINIWV